MRDGSRAPRLYRRAYENDDAIYHRRRVRVSSAMSLHATSTRARLYRSIASTELGLYRRANGSNARAQSIAAGCITVPTNTCDAAKTTSWNHHGGFPVRASTGHHTARAGVDVVVVPVDGFASRVVVVDRVFPVDAFARARTTASRRRAGRARARVRAAVAWASAREDMEK